MKVKIKPYVNFIGPYQIAEKVLFWKDPYSDSVMNLGEFLSGGEEEDGWLLNLCNRIYEYRTRKSRASIRIDPYDTWSMDETLAHIIYPMLLQLKEHKHGSAMVDDKDVPDNIKIVEGENPDQVHARWDYVLDEMIWAFNYKLNDDSDEYSIENENRMANGFRLFGTYYQGLWD